MTPCYKCSFYQTCGGMVEDGVADFSCMLRCGQCKSLSGECPFACPNNEARLVWMVAEVKSLSYRPLLQFKAHSKDPWPFFAPQIYHGSCRWKPLDVGCVTIGIADLLARTKPTDSPIEVRRKFRLADATKIIGIGVARDHLLERWWAEKDIVAERLATMDLEAVTTPNFSIFANSPRTQSLVSIARIHHFSETLTKAGVPTVPHLYAETDMDWQRWTSVLLEQRNVQTIAMEFQTGLNNEVDARRYIEKLAELRESIGRPLHLIAIGGTRFSSILKSIFARSFTLTDATSFVKTWNRRRVDHGLPEEACAQEPGTDLTDLLQANIESREARLRKKLALTTRSLAA